MNAQFREQCEMIDHAIELYTAGKQFAPKWLAGAVATLVYDPYSARKGSRARSSMSLLRQMEIKDKIQYLSTAKPFTKYNVPWAPLVNLQGGPGDNWHFVPMFDMLKKYWKFVPFSNWWEEAVFKTPEDKSLSRKNLTLSLRDQDGFGHIDEALTDDEYIMMRNTADPRITRIKMPAGSPADPSMISYESVAQAKQLMGPNEEPVPGAHLATMCQIAWELRQSIGTIL